MTLTAPVQTITSTCDPVTLRQRTAQPFLIPPHAEADASFRPKIRLHVCIEDLELRSAVHALFDARDRFEVVSGSVTFSENARVRVGRLEEAKFSGIPVDGTPVVLIGPDLSDEAILSAIRSGAWAYVSEQSSGDELANAVEQAANGECPILRGIAGRPGAAAALIKQLSRPEPVSVSKAPLVPSPLTESETEILCRVAMGQTTRQIAGELGFQEQTIKNRIVGIFNKLGPRSRAGAVAEAQRQGWL